MDSTLLIALLAATLSLMLLAVTVLLVVALVLFVWRSRQGAGVGFHEEITPVAFERDLSLVPPSAAIPAVPPAAASSQPGGLIGFFDDESSAPGLDSKGAGLFAPSGGGAWPDDNSEEGEATEIFSSHSAAADLAGFAFDEADEATGRFPKSESR